MNSLKILTFLVVLEKKLQKKKPFSMNSGLNKNIPFMDDAEIKFFKNRLNKHGWDVKAYEDNYQTMSYDFKPLQSQESIMKKSELKKIIKEELNNVLGEALQKLNPQELKMTKEHFEPILKKHGGKVVQYFKSMGEFACEIESFRVLYNSLVVAQCMSQKDAQNIVDAFKDNDAKLITNPKEMNMRISPDRTFLYWK